MVVPRVLQPDSPQGPGLLCSISSSESVICRILSYRLGGEFLSSNLGKDQRGAWWWAWRRPSPLLHTSLQSLHVGVARSVMQREAGSSLHQYILFSLKGAHCEAIPYFGLL